MSRCFIFATTSDILALRTIANAVFDRVLETKPGNEINCYCDNSGILLNSSDDPKIDYASDFRDSLKLFDNYPIKIPLEKFNFFYGQIFGDISCTNKLFINLSDLMIMINFPKIIIYQDLLSMVKMDMDYDWYKNEENLAITPSYF